MKLFIEQDDRSNLIHPNFYLKRVFSEGKCETSNTTDAPGGAGTANFSEHLFHRVHFTQALPFSVSFCTYAYMLIFCLSFDGLGLARFLNKRFTSFPLLSLNSI